DVIERCRLERQREDVRLTEPYVGEAGRVDLRFGFRERVDGDVDGRDARAGTVAGERDRLRAGPAPGFEHGAAFGVRGVVMEEIDETVRLVLQANALALIVAVHVGAAHRVSASAAGRPTSPARSA